MVQSEHLAYAFQVRGGPTDRVRLGRVVIFVIGADHETHVFDEWTAATRRYGSFELRSVSHSLTLIFIETPSELISSLQDCGGFFVDHLVGPHDFWVHSIVFPSDLNYNGRNALT